MSDCDYCEASFDGEDAYLDHLAAAHDGELSAIDRRRVDNHESDGDGGVPTTTVVAGLAVVGLVALVGALLLGSGSGPGGGQTTDGTVTAEGNTIVSFGGSAPDGIETAPLPDSGREDVVGVVAEEPYTGPSPPPHLSPSELNYQRTPPTAGPHTGDTVPAGFYEETPPLGALVHTLEHGAVVIYYDPESITPEARESLRTFANQHTGTWQSVVVVPHPGDSPPAYELTAWEHRLEMETYDARAVRAFVAEYIGRGPENPVR